MWNDSFHSSTVFEAEQWWKATRHIIGKQATHHFNQRLPSPSGKTPQIPPLTPKTSTLDPKPHHYP